MRREFMGRRANRGGSSSTKSAMQVARCRERREGESQLLSGVSNVLSAITSEIATLRQ
jgi:hypothetical protein